MLKTMTYCNLEKVVLRLKPNFTDVLDLIEDIEEGYCESLLPCQKDFIRQVFYSNSKEKLYRKLRGVESSRRYCKI